MSSISENYLKIKSDIPPDVKLIVVSKTHPAKEILEIYQAGARLFGENKVQELLDKQPFLPTDIEWHLIGHLQTNKVKNIAPFISLIHSIDSLKLLQEVNKQAQKNNRRIDCLLQIHIAKEDTKFGFSIEEANTLLQSGEINNLNNVRVIGLMGMATNTDNKEQINNEFKALRLFFDECQSLVKDNVEMSCLSMGMSSDYKAAIESGSNMIRVGSSIFGHREYNKQLPLHKNL